MSVEAILHKSHVASPLRCIQGVAQLYLHNTKLMALCFNFSFHSLMVISGSVYSPTTLYVLQFVHFTAVLLWVWGEICPPQVSPDTQCWCTLREKSILSKKIIIILTPPPKKKITDSFNLRLNLEIAGLYARGEYEAHPWLYLYILCLII